MVFIIVNNVCEVTTRMLYWGFVSCWCRLLPILVWSKVYPGSICMCVHCDQCWKHSGGGWSEPTTQCLFPVSSIWQGCLFSLKPFVFGVVFVLSGFVDISLKIFCMMYYLKGQCSQIRDALCFIFPPDEVGIILWNCGNDGSCPFKCKSCLKRPAAISACLGGMVLWSAWCHQAVNELIDQYEREFQTFLPR